MAHTTPLIHVVEKADYTKQHLVAVADAYPLPPLGPNSIRIRSRLLALTTNNFTYAKRGGILGWWDAWTFPPTLDIDEAKYTRISAWGYAEVVESTHPDVSPGNVLYGYQPIGTYPETLEVAIDPETGHVLETSSRRAARLSAYSRYIPHPPGGADPLADRTGSAWNALARPLFGTADLFNRYAWAWDAARVVPPTGDAALPWSPADADLAGAVVVLLAASGKTALSFAHLLRHGRPAGARPARVVAVGSEASRAFSAGTGLFDDVVLYGDVQDDVLAKLGVGRDTKVVMFNFAARGDADAEWFEALKAAAGKVTAVIVGGDPKGRGPSKLRSLLGDPTSGVVQGNAVRLRDMAVAAESSAVKYWEGFEEEFARFKESGVIKGMTMKWGKGIEAFSKGWDELAEGKVGPDVGLVYDI